MKTLASFSALLLLSASALFTPSVAQSTPSNDAYYQERPQLAAVVYPASDPLKLWVVVEKEDLTANLRIELLDARNRQLHTETVGRRMNKVCQRFDLSQLPDGRYTFRITDGNTVQERTFKLSSPGLQEQLPSRLVTMN
jgi:hypothetical protein